MCSWLLLVADKQLHATLESSWDLVRFDRRAWWCSHEDRALSFRPHCWVAWSCWAQWKRHVDGFRCFQWQRMFSANNASFDCFGHLYDRHIFSGWLGVICILTLGPSDHPRALEVIGILAALNNKHNTGLGQHVDISMLDVAVALLANQGMNYLAKKQRQKRVGNNHPNVVPYQVMPAKDGVLSTGRIWWRKNGFKCGCGKCILGNAIIGQWDTHKWPKWLDECWFLV